MSTNIDNQYNLQVICALFLAGSCFGIPGSPADGSEVNKVWVTVYRELNDGAFPKWTKRSEMQEWASSERARIEPIVLQILNGKREGVRWTAGLAIAREIPSDTISKALVPRMEDIVVRHQHKTIPRASQDETVLINIIYILSKNQKRLGARSVRALVLIPDQSAVVIEHCLKALQVFGNAKDLELVQRVAQVRGERHIQRLCAMTERVIDARVRGVAVSPNAQKELEVLAQKLVVSVKNKNYDLYKDLLMSEIGIALITTEIENEVFDNKNMNDLVDMIEAALGEPFEIDATGLRAILPLGDGHQLECVLELEGWKVANVR